MNATTAMGLVAEDRARLIRILGMLGSAYPGERDAAALAASRFLLGRGCTWEDVLQPNAEPRASRPEPSAPPPPRTNRPENWRDEAAFCLDNLDLISRDELWFCLRLARGTDPITPAKYDRLTGIVARLDAARRARP
jgi:hypothetical protein